MTTSKQKPWMTVALLAAISCAVNAQTNVSGDIDTNATWTKANSPYIVTSTVVVFPGNTLTIEPGVEVRFDDDVMLEIRQAAISAIGTSGDSITFTSNSPIPVPGSWDKIWLNGGSLVSKFSYCNFYYATTATSGNISDTLIVTNSVFSYNLSGYSLYTAITIMDSCNFTHNINDGINLSGGYGIISNCNFLNNGTGIRGSDTGGSFKFINCRSAHNITGMSYSNPYVEFNTILLNSIINNNIVGIMRPDTSAKGDLNIANSIIDSNSAVGIYAGVFDHIFNCQISYNGTGIDDSLAFDPIIQQNIIENNTIGIKWRTDYPFNEIHCNRICNNTSYDFYRASATGFDATNNYWCSSDSAAIAAKIYDGYDNVSLGLVNFMPFDSFHCYSTGALISGKVKTEGGTPIPGVIVTLSGDATQTTTTLDNGRYNFTVPQGGNYTITPLKNNDLTTNNGITTLDIVQMRRHILSVLGLSTPFKIIAADVDSSGNVSTLDILHTRSMILQMTTTFPSGRLWSFVPADHVFADMQNPFPFPTTRTYTNLQQSVTNEDFIGIKLGDVNGSWDAGIP